MARRENRKENEGSGGAVREGWHGEGTGNGRKSVGILNDETLFKCLTQASAGLVFQPGPGSPPEE
jgi:hypothetical protein